MAEIDFPSIEERAEVLPATRADVGRRLAQQLAQNRRRAIEHRVILRQPFGVTRGKFRDFRLRRCQSATDFEVTLSRQRKKVREWPRSTFQASKSAPKSCRPRAPMLGGVWRNNSRRIAAARSSIA